MRDVRRTVRPALAASLAATLLVAACAAPAGGDRAATATPGSALATTPASRPAATRAATPTAATPAPPAKVPAIREETVQRGLSLPWDLAFLPDGRMLVTERAGTLLVFESGEPNARRLAAHPVPDVRAQGESGLMGVAVDPAFATNRLLYLCASRTDEGEWRNQVLRFRLDATALVFDGYVIRQGMRAAAIHDGCRILIGPDGKLWATMGDASQSSLSQDVNSLNGKVLRVNTDGTIPADNPVLAGAAGRTAVYSYGHRNPQGLAFEPGTGRLFEVEHGQNDHDEINLIRPGANYGWPAQRGPGGTARGFVDPLWTSGAAGTLATSGGAFVSGPQWGLWSGSLFVASLKEADLRRFSVAGETVTERETLLDRTYGRLRSPLLGPGGALYVTTSAGSGDRIIRLVPSLD